MFKSAVVLWSFLCLAGRSTTATAENTPTLLALESAVAAPINFSRIEACLYQTKYAAFIRIPSTITHNESFMTVDATTQPPQPNTSMLAITNVTSTYLSPAAVTLQETVLDILLNCWLPQASIPLGDTWNITILAHHQTVSVDKQARRLGFNGPIHVKSVYSNDGLELNRLNQYVRSQKVAKLLRTKTLHFTNCSQQEALIRRALGVPVLSSYSATNWLFMPHQLNDSKRLSIELHSNRVQSLFGFIDGSDVKCQNEIDSFPFDQMVCFFLFRIDGMVLNDSIEVVGRYEQLFLNIVRERQPNAGIRKVLINADYNSEFTTFWNTYSDDDEWDTDRTAPLYCTRSLNAVHCIGALVLSRSWRKYVFSWLTAMNILAVLNIVGLFGHCPRADRFSFGITSLMPSAMFLFTIHDELPLPNNTYPTIGFYNLIIFSNCVIATLISNVQHDKTKWLISKDVKMISKQFRRNVGGFVVWTGGFIGQHARVLTMVLFLVVHVATNAWACGVWFSTAETVINEVHQTWWRGSLAAMHPEINKNITLKQFAWAWSCEQRCVAVEPFDAHDNDHRSE